MPKYSTAFGMDVHLRSTTVCALDADTGEAVTRRFPGVSVNLFFTSFAKQAHRSRKGGFTGCANVFSPIPVTA